MKVLLAARDARSLSGVSTVIRELAGGLARAGHEVRLASLRPPQSLPDGARPLRLAMLPFTSTLRAWSFDLAARLAARTLGADIVHGHGDLTVQDVLTVNNVDAAEAHHTGRKRVGSRGTLFIRARQFARGRVRRIVTVSRKAKEDLRAFYGVEPARVEVVYLGVDCARFSPQGREGERDRLRTSLGLPRESRLFLSLISGDARRRNTRGLVEAFRRARLGEADVLVIVGDPEAEGYPGARELAGQGRLRLLPRTAEPEKVYRACDAFLLPAHYETFGMTALEAMASGLPTAVTAACGVAELITDGDNGLVVADSRDGAALSRAIERLAGEPGLAESLAARGLETARGMTWARTVEGYLNLYERVLAEKSAPHVEVPPPGKERAP